MKQEDFDLLSQYVDGELDQQSSAKVKQRLLSEPELNQQYRELKALQDNVRDVIPDFNDEPVSNALAELLSIDSEQKDASSFANTSVSSVSWPHYLSLAASVVFVAVLGIFWMKNDNNDQTGLQLDTELFSSLKSNESWSSGDLELMIVQSYLDENQQLCREYFAKDKEHNEHGVTCLENGSWSKQVFELNFNQLDSHYMTASSTDNEGVEAFIKSKTLTTLTLQQESSQLDAMQ